MDLSIVDLAPVRRGQSATEAFRDTLDLANVAADVGYKRFWVAEHHGMADSVASATPEVLIAHLAARTEGIRVGSGTVLLNFYSPFKVAETFSTLDGLTPGRIDLGLGRATGLPAADHALRAGAPHQDPEMDHGEKIEAVAKHLAGAFPDDHAYSDITLPRSAADAPEIWVLGSSPMSARIAGELGFPYAFAAFIRPELARSAFETYHDSFEASRWDLGREEPHGMLAINAACASTDDAAARLRAHAEATYQRLARGARGGPALTLEESLDEIGGVPEPTPVSVIDEDWPRSVSGSPETLRTILTGMAEEVGARELMLQPSISDPDERARCDELLAEAF